MADQPMRRTDLANNGVAPVQTDQNKQRNDQEEEEGAQDAQSE